MYRLKTVIYKYELLNNSYLFTQYLSAYQNDQSNPIFVFCFSYLSAQKIPIFNQDYLK